MTRRSRKDANQGPIARCFVDLGCSVVDMHSVGIPGWPDLAVGCIGRTHLVEVKNPDTAYGRAGLNGNQMAFDRDWRGERMACVSSVDEVAELVNSWRRRA